MISLCLQGGEKRVPGTGGGGQGNIAKYNIPNIMILHKSQAIMLGISCGYGLFFGETLW